MSNTSKPQQGNRTASAVLFSNIASMLMGKKVNEIKLKGSPEQVKVIKEAISATKKFQDQLMSPDATLDSITQSLSVKHEAAARFEKVLGTPWLL